MKWRAWLFAIVVLFAGAYSAIATISSSLNSITVAGNGVQTAFTFPFVGVAIADISVIYTNSAGVPTTLVQGPGATQYQVTLNAAVYPSLWGVGGTITYDPSGTPIAAGTTLTIVRTLPYLQQTSLQNQASWGQLASATEQALDMLEMQIQQIGNGFARAIQGPVSDPSGLSYTLPAAAVRANEALGFDGLGQPTAISVLPSGTVSSAMQPVVNAASLAAGRLSFGLGSMSQENINGGSCGGASIQDDGSAGGANGVGYARVVPATVADSINQSVTCAFHWQQHIATGPITYTLARANTLFNGFGFWIYAVPNGSIITLAPNAADTFQNSTSGTSTTLAPGTWSFITTDGASSGNWYVNATMRPTGFDMPVNLGLTDTSNGTALTFNVTTASGAAPSPTNPVVVPFRSTTLTAGNNMLASITAPLSLIIPGSATLGTASSNVPFRVWLLLGYNAGVPEIVAATCSTTTRIYPCTSWESNRITTTTISSGATAAGTPYATAGVSSDAVRIIGYCDFSSGLSTAGTWASACSSLQLMGPGVNKPGAVVQTVTGSSTSSSTTTSSSFAAIGPTLTITPSSTPNLIDVLVSGSMEISTAGGAFVQLTRTISASTTAIGVPVGLSQGSGTDVGLGATLPFLDAPGSVAAVTYGTQGKTSAGTLSFPPGNTGVVTKLNEIMGSIAPANDNDPALSKAA